jgi:hypothetical protein
MINVLHGMKKLTIEESKRFPLASKKEGKIIPQIEF